MRVRLLILAPVLVLLSGCAGAGVMLAADVASAAIQAGVDYAEKHKPTPDEALQQFKIALLRERGLDGDADAQYILGLYFQVVRDAEARGWMCRAANQGHAKAQVNLGHWYNEDRKREDLWPFIRLRPDNREAYVWYSLAAANGEVLATHFRDQISAVISAETLAEARARLVQWSPSPCGYIAAASLEASTPSGSSK